MHLTPLLLVLIMANSAFAHNGHHPISTKVSPETLKQINLDYIREVKPIFQKSCFNCHSSSIQYPWYYNLPGAKQLIDHDIKESKEHLDMTNDFPFAGHGSPQEDLEAIETVLKEGSMPPFRYRIMHQSSVVTSEELKRVQEWIEKSKQELLKQK
jgi:hypothetical protein